jgi:hypothetical protein
VRTPAALTRDKRSGWLRVIDTVIVSLLCVLLLGGAALQAYGGFIVLNDLLRTSRGVLPVGTAVAVPGLVVCWTSWLFVGLMCAFPSFRRQMRAAWREIE